ncbi:MAG TPA: DUF1800 domain-containing protein [Planctomycetaceae bacterium]|nr:DUF1800 domain-containing protein [Planctomycetaceae bacterium]
MIHFDAPAAAHLLRRLQFGVTPAEVDRAVRDGLHATLERLFTPQPESAEFLASQAALKDAAVATASIQDLKAWWLHRMAGTANPVTEKMTLFWHNHFATSAVKVQSVPMMVEQNDLFRNLGAGSFRQLLTAMARDPAMLVWLDGNANRKRHPNENFAREVMELFALGLGNYTEHDIQEAARAFSGWHLRDGRFWFNDSQHDDTAKTVFGKTGRYDGQAIIDLCLDHPACPKFLAFKLLRTFVTTEPSGPQVERIAGLFVKHDLAFAPVLREVCSSDEFYAAEVRGSIIKSPVELILGTLRPLCERIRWPAVRDLAAQLGQDVFAPPSVKGWDGGRQWVHATAWIQRWNFLSDVTGSDRYGHFRSEVREQIQQHPREWVTALFAVPLADTMHTAISALAPDERLPFALSLPEYQLM